MFGVYRWVVGIASKNWASMSGDGPASTFLQMPPDVFVNICEWLSVRDILALRMTNKFLARITRESIIWNSLLRRLMVPLPILPATSKYRFGEMDPRGYEWLLARALYLEQNWRRRNPVASYSRFEAFDCAIAMKLLPGGKYMITVTKNLDFKLYSLIVWDLDHAGKRVALVGGRSKTPFLKLEAKYGDVEGKTCIVVAYAKPQTETKKGILTEVIVSAVPVLILEELAILQSDPKRFQSFARTVEFPFSVIHHSMTSCAVGQLALGDFDGELVLLVVHRPRAMIFHYLGSRQRGNLLLGPIHPYEDLRHSIWSAKLLPSQNSVLVSRVLLEVGVPRDSTLFTLDMFLLPGPGETCKSPMPMGRQLLSGLHIDGFHFSDLETSWFSSLRDPEGLLPAPVNNEPPPISIFITTQNPRGFVQCIMRPEPVPNDYIQLPYKRGWIRRFVYSLPAIKVERDIWTDNYARPVILAGAYRSIISMRPHVHPRLQEEGSGSAVEVLRFCTHATSAEGYNAFSTTRATGNLHAAGAMQVEEQVNSPAAQQEEELGLRKRTLRVPTIPTDIAWDMMYGTTAVAFDESVGRMCIATNQDTCINVLDFGGEGWELAVVKT